MTQELNCDKRKFSFKRGRQSRRIQFYFSVDNTEHLICQKHNVSIGSPWDMCLPFTLSSTSLSSSAIFKPPCSSTICLFCFPLRPCFLMLWFMKTNFIVSSQTPSFLPRCFELCMMNLGCRSNEFVS